MHVFIGGTGADRGTALLQMHSPYEEMMGIQARGPGIVEAFRMVSEGLEKTTGTEQLDGIWRYERRPPLERLNIESGILQ